jgi:hypothetical protein
MLIIAMFSWWYGQGWHRMSQLAWERLVRVGHLFSAPILLRTLFAPWRRIVTEPGAGLDAKFRALIDNLISRLVGFIIRIFVLITAGLFLLATAAYGGVSVVLWPLVPLLIPGLIVLGAAT